jgi:cyclase
MRWRDVLWAGVGTAGVYLVAGAARGDDPVAESDPAEGIKKAQAFFAAPAEATRLTDRLSLVTGPGGNMAVLGGPDGVLMVDSGLPGRTDDVRKVAEAAGGGPVQVLINTHWHMDHAGGNAALAKVGARVWGTANTRKRLGSDQYNEAFKMKSPASPPEALPIVTLDEAEVYADGEEIHLIAVPPAHTDGDLVIHFRKADVIHCGDVVNNGFYPNIDADSRGWLGGMVAAAGRILEMAGPRTRIIPGHGPLGTVDDLKAYRKMLVGVYDKLAPMVDAGKSVEDVIRARPTADYDAAFGKGIFNGPMFTRLAYGGLVKHREEAGKS